MELLRPVELARQTRQVELPVNRRGSDFPVFAFSKIAWHRSVILQVMQSRSARITVTLVLLICIICPLVETFDYWDQTMQTGNDTEYALVVLALCVGVGYSFMRSIFKSTLLGFVTNGVFAARAQRLFFSAPSRLNLLLFEPVSPPALPLRI